MTTAHLALATVLAAALAGCPKPRTSAATQPTPAAFDPAASDAKALELADASLAALGGYDKWTGLKELSFTAKYKLNDELKSWVMHKWDRWNGRHNFQYVELSSITGKPDDIKIHEVRYDLFDKSRKPYATFDGKEIMRADAEQAAIQAAKRLSEEGYLITVIYRVRDPGVILKMGAPVKIEGKCDACESVNLTFDPAVGKDTWVVSYDPATKLPVAIGQEVAGKGLIGYRIEGWHDAGGLKWPAGLHNIGLAGEIWELSDVGVGEPDDYTYVRSVGE